MTLAGSTTGRRFTLVALLALTMAGRSHVHFVPVGVLASSIRQDLGLEPWQLGLLVTGSPLVGALLAPALGRVSPTGSVGNDRLSSPGGGGADARPLAASPTFVILQSAMYRGEPGMGKLGDQQGDLGELPPVGVASSRHAVGGAQFGALSPGWRYPVALALGWRGAPLAATIPLLGTCWQPSSCQRPSDHLCSTASDDHRYRVRCVSSPCTGFLLGLTVSATIGYTALFAEDVLGFSPATAGVVAVREWWACWDGCCGARRRRGKAHRNPRVLGVVGAAAGLLMVGAAAIDPILVWPAAVATGAGINAWNAGCWPWFRWFPRMRQVRRQECSSIPDGPRPGRPHSAPWLTPPAPMCRVGSVSPSSVCSHHY